MKIPVPGAIIAGELEEETPNVDFVRHLELPVIHFELKSY